MLSLATVPTSPCEARSPATRSVDCIDSLMVHFHYKIFMYSMCIRVAAAQDSAAAGCAICVLFQHALLVVGCQLGLIGLEGVVAGVSVKDASRRFAVQLRT